MGYRRRFEVPQKLELTSIIDIVFLLLIYFLVTSVMFPVLTGGETAKGNEEVGVPKMDPTRTSETDAFIVIYPFGVEDYGYYFFSEQTDRNAFRQELSNLNAPQHIAQYRNYYSTGSGYGFELNLRQLAESLRGVSRVTIKAPATVPFRQVMQIYDLCRQANPAAAVSLLIHPGKENIFDNLEFKPGEHKHIKIYG